MPLFNKILTEIKADNSDFKKKVDESKKKTDDFGSSLARFGKVAATAIGVTAVAGFAALLHIIQSTTDEISKLHDTALKMGGSVGGFQKLQYAAKLSGMSTEELQSGMTKLTKTFFAAQDGSTKASDAFKKLGLSTTALNGLSIDERYLAVAKALGGITDKTEQARLSFVLFGKTGINQLALIRDGVNGAFDDFDKFGGALSNEQADAVDSYGDSVEKLKATFGVFATQLTAAVAPALEQLVNFTQEAIVSYGGFGDVAKDVGIFLINGMIGAIKGFQFFLDLLHSAKIRFEELKLSALQFYQAVNKAKFNAFGGDLDMNVGVDIHKLSRDIRRMDNVSTDTTSGLISGLEKARDAISNTGQNKVVEITIKPAPQFEVEIAQSNAVSMAVRTAVANITANEAQATIASGG